MSDRGEKITIYIPGGISRRGIKVAEIMNWTGQVLICQREEIKRLESEWKEEVQRQGVYILFGWKESERKPDVYIGEAENVMVRLRMHITKKDFWEKVFIFTNKDENINKTHFKYLESRMVRLVRDAEKVNLENGNVPQPPSISRPDQSMAERYLEHAVALLDTLGFSYLQSSETTRSPERSTEKPKRSSRETFQYNTDTSSPTAIISSKKRNENKTTSSTPSHLGLPKVKDIIAAGLMKAGDEIWLKNRYRQRAILTAAGQCEYEGRQMSLRKYAKIISGWSSVNIYQFMNHAPSGKTIGELRAEIPKSYLDAHPNSVSPESSASYPDDSGLKSNDGNKGAAKSSGKSLRVNLPKVKNILAAGLMKAGDAIWFKMKPNQKAVLTANGQCEYRGRQMNLAEFGMVVSGWKAVNIYQFMIHGPSGKTIGYLRDRLPKLHSDLRSKPVPTERLLSNAEKARSPDSASGIRLYFNNPNKGADAQAIYSSAGFLVLAGSSGPRDVKKYFTPANRIRRGDLLDRGEIELRGDRLYFVQDVLFKSPSTAAEMVSGASQNGRVVWKDKNGKTLKEIQQGSS